MSPMTYLTIDCERTSQRYKDSPGSAKTPAKSGLAVQELPAKTSCLQKDAVTSTVFQEGPCHPRLPKKDFLMAPAAYLAISDFKVSPSRELRIYSQRS